MIQLTKKQKAWLRSQPRRKWRRESRKSLSRRLSGRRLIQHSMHPLYGLLVVPGPGAVVGDVRGQRYEVQAGKFLVRLSEKE